MEQLVLELVFLWDPSFPGTSLHVRPQYQQPNQTFNTLPFYVLLQVIYVLSLIHPLKISTFS